MPALSSSPIGPVIGHLADLTEDAAGDPPGLLAALARVADPRHRRGVRHRLAVILWLAVCAVLAGSGRVGSGIVTRTGQGDNLSACNAITALITLH